MSDVMVLEDMINAAWVHQVKLMARDASAFDEYPFPQHAALKKYEDNIHLYHLEATWPLRELVRLPIPAAGSNVYQLLVAWWIGDGTVRRSMLDAGMAFAVEFGADPQFAFIREIPMGAQEFMEVGGICLGQAEWVPVGFLVVTSGGMTRNLPRFKRLSE